MARRARPFGATPRVWAEDDAAEAAIRSARRARDASPDDARALFGLATLLLRRGDPEALSLLLQLDRHDDFAAGWLSIGDALISRGQVNAALTAIGRAMRTLHGGALSVAQVARAHHLHGRALAAAGRVEEARQAFETGIGVDPDHAEGWYSLGLLHQDRRRHGDAAEAYRRALVVRPTLHEAALNLGVALGECGRREDALDAYGHALALRPESFGRIAQALTSGRCGLIALDPGRLRQMLEGRGTAFQSGIASGCRPS